VRRSGETIEDVSSVVAGPPPQPVVVLVAAGTDVVHKPFVLGDSSYASLYFVTTGFHMAHVLIGLAVLAALFGWTLLDYFSPRRQLAVSAGVIYWHFVDIVWLCVFTTYYVTPYLGFGT